MSAEEEQDKIREMLERAIQKPMSLTDAIEFCKAVIEDVEVQIENLEEDLRRESES